MNPADLVVLYDYNYWASKKILDQTATLTPEQYTAPASVPFGSLRGTLVHTLSAERNWRRRCQERFSPTAMLVEADYPTFDDLIALWQQEEATMRAYIASLTEADLQERIHYRDSRGNPFDVPLHLILTHVVNHGTQHRSECGIMLTDFGHSPGNIDFIYYVLDNKL